VSYFSFLSFVFILSLSIALWGFFFVLFLFVSFFLFYFFFRTQLHLCKFDLQNGSLAELEAISAGG